jgi:hypothetical protein
VDELDTYARAAARLSRLEIDDVWWPGVRRHLGVLFDRAALFEAVDLATPRSASPGAPAAEAGGRAGDAAGGAPGGPAAETGGQR